MNADLASRSYFSVAPIPPPSLSSTKVLASTARPTSMPLFERDAYRYSVLNTDRTRPHMISILDKYSSRRFFVTSLSVVFLLCVSFIIGRYSVTDVSLMTIPCTCKAIRGFIRVQSISTKKRYSGHRIESFPLRSQIRFASFQ